MDTMTVIEGFIAGYRSRFRGADGELDLWTVQYDGTRKNVCDVRFAVELKPR